MSAAEHSHITSIMKKICQELDSNPESVEKYIHAFKLANLGNLLGGIAHTFNNILGGILGYSQLLKEELEPTSDAYRQAEVIEKASKRASKLISQLQFYSHTQSFRRSIVDPKQIVDEVAAIIRSSFNRNIEITLRFAHAKARVNVDMPAICHALLTVCLNSKDAMPDGGKLCIETELSGVSDNGTVNNDNEKYLVFRISDSGVGIKEEYLPFIFVPFFTTKESNASSGVGLTIAKSIVKEHGGRITAESEVGKGTTFYIAIPLANNSEFAKADVTEVCDEDPVEEGELIMVVDDEEELGKMAKQILEKKGFRVLLADSGQRAIEVFMENANDIRLVILDMILPGVDGTEVYKQLKGLSGKSKFILTSGYVKNSPFQDIIENGIDTFVPKPWDLPELIKETQRVLRRTKIPSCK